MMRLPPLLLLAAMLGLTTSCASARRPPEGYVAATDHEYLRSRWLMVPVQGIRARDVIDTYAAARGGGRTHNATDILAKRGTPVLASDDGRIIRLARNDAGGITVYATDPAERFIFYYAHLDRYHEGIAEGMKLAKGQIIGYVGTTGNAPENTPHLHFQAIRARDVRRWWEGEPVDVRPYLVEDGQRR
jgi:murein DD-endopeptidase MepM/ murein hydrolase activator NlpD